MILRDLRETFNVFLCRDAFIGLMVILGAGALAVAGFFSMTALEWPVPTDESARSSGWMKFLLPMLFLFFTGTVFFLWDRGRLHRFTRRLGKLESDPDRCDFLHTLPRLPCGLSDALRSYLLLVKEKARALQDELDATRVISKVSQYKRAQLEKLLDTMQDSVIVLDETGAVVLANKGAENMLGISLEEMREGRIHDWCPDEDLAGFLARSCNSGLRRREEITYAPIRRPNRTVLVCAQPVLDGDENMKTFTLITSRDVTAEMMARQARSDFVAHVSHELKSPLNVLKMYGELLQGEEGRDENFRIDAINTINDEVERLRHLVNNLLSISQIEMGSIKMDRQRVKTIDFLRDIFQAATRGGREQDLQFHLRLPHDMSPLMIDKDLFRVAVNNFLTNAIKYNKQGGSVTLAAEETESRIQIHIQDTGIGIASEDMERIFDKFYRSQQEEIRNRGGHGLGLPLAKGIIELHHGTVTVTSRPGEGSRFTISFEKKQGLVREGI